MTSDDKKIKLDERNHVEKPLLDQLAGLGWEIFDLDAKQHPGASQRNNFTEVVMLPVTLRIVKALKKAESEDYYDRETNFTPFSLKT